MGDIAKQRDLLYKKLEKLKEEMYEAHKIVSSMTPNREPSLINDASDLHDQLKYVRLLTRQYELIYSSYRKMKHQQARNSSNDIGQ